MDQPQDSRFDRRRITGPTVTTGGLAGIVIILVGIAMLLDTLGILPAHDIWDYLPLVLVGFGVVTIVQSHHQSGGIIFGGLLAAVGTVWFLDNLHLFRVGQFIAPLVLIGIGAVMLVRVFFPSKGVSPGGTQGESSFQQWAVFSGSKRAIDSAAFTGGEVFSMFGGVELDLRRAKLASNQEIIVANAIFGGVEIKVPTGWSVVMRGMAVFGGFEDKTLHPDTREGTQELVVTGYALFGGVAISN